MATPNPDSVLSRQSALLADIDRVLDDPLPEWGDQLPGLAAVYAREWLTGPLLTLGRQLVRPPAPDDPSGDRWVRSAAYLLRLAHEAADAERTAAEAEPPIPDLVIQRPPDDVHQRLPWLRTAAHILGVDLDSPGREQVGAETARDEPESSSEVVTTLEHEMMRWRSCSGADRDHLKAAIRAAAEPLLPRTHQGLFAWVVNREAVTHEPSARQQTPPRRVRGKNIDTQMLKVLAEKPESYGWSARQWADCLDCSDGTVKATKTWKKRLKNARGCAAADAAIRMDRSPTFRRGRRKPQHRSEA